MEWLFQLSGPFLYRVQWTANFNTNSDDMDTIVHSCASTWDDVMLRLRASTVDVDQRVFCYSDIARFEDQHRSPERRLRAVLHEYFMRSSEHNVGTLYISLHDAGCGAVADRVLAEKVVYRAAVQSPAAHQRACRAPACLCSSKCPVKHAEDSTESVDPPYCSVPLAALVYTVLGAALGCLMVYKCSALLWKK